MDGARDNGLRAGNYMPIAELDPRVADDLLSALRDHGIAAYALPASGTVGGAMETRLPARPMDRLYVDDQRIDEARELLRREAPEPDPEQESAPAPDFEASWQQVLTSLQSSPTHMTSPWPEREELSLAEREQDYDELVRDLEEEHYVPPPAPPLPRLRRATLGALATMAFALFVMLTDAGGRLLSVLAFVVFVAAAGSLVYNMRPGPPSSESDDDDDGAVV
jgi:hypothetical protein